MGDTIDVNVNLSTKGFEKGSQRVKEAVRSMSDKANDMGKSTESAMSKVGKGFSAAGNMAKSFSQTIKNSIKTIIGIGTAYQIISKSVSAYMSQNQKLSQQMNSVWTAFGNLLGPIIERIIGLVTSAVSYLLSFMKLLGLTTKSASQLSKSAKGAGGSIQATVAGFDELNKLQDGGGGGGGAGLEDKDPTEWMKKIQELIAKKQWEDLGKEIGKKVTEIIVGIPRKISELIKKVDWKEVGRAIVGVIKGFFEGFSVRDILDSLVTLAHDIWNAFLDVLWGIMEDDTGDEPPLVASLRSLGDAVEELYTTIMDSWETNIKPILEEAYETVIKPIIDWLTDEALPWLIDKITALVKLISDYWPVIEPILLAIGAIILGFGIYQKISGLISVIGGPLMKVISALWKLILANPIAILIAAIVALVVLIATKGDEIQALLQKLDGWLQGVFSRDWTQIFGPVLGSILNGFFANVKNIWAGIKQVFDGIIDFIRGVFTGDWERAWTGVKNIFAGIANTLTAIFKAPLNGIISLINGAIGGINSLINKFNNGLGSVIGVSIGTIGNIPYLARGGVLKKGQVGLLEGNGAEAVVPLEKNTEWIGKVADGFVERLGHNSGIANGLAALSAIGDSVPFRVPAVAAGTVTPYSVSSASGYDSSAETDSEILRLIEALYELLERFVTGMDNMQFVAEFEDIRALAKKITKEQRRQTISEGM